MVDIDTAYKNADRMIKPWQWATIVLSLTVAGILYRNTQVCKTLLQISQQQQIQYNR